MPYEPRFDEDKVEECIRSWEEDEGIIWKEDIYIRKIRGLVVEVELGSVQYLSEQEIKAEENRCINVTREKIMKRRFPPLSGRSRVIEKSDKISLCVRLGLEFLNPENLPPQDK